LKNYIILFSFRFQRILFFLNLFWPLCCWFIGSFALHRIRFFPRYRILNACRHRMNKYILSQIHRSQGAAKKKWQ